ncbi:MAG: insulinase family protein, partial [Sphingomonadales bacterium]|nr:insulinase family protein [Sphingomonadales bacterium]
MKSKLLRATALGLAVSFAVPAAAVMAKSSTADLVADVQIPYEKFTLQNGLRVIVHEDRKAPIVAVSVWYHVGSKDEKVGKTGFAHLFEHLMFNGSENYNDEYFAPFEQVGATAMNGTTWLDRTNYFQNVPTPALDMALWMESDRMGHMLGAVTQEKLDEQRGVVQNEKRQGDNQPYGKSRYSVQEGLFPQGHPYRWSTIGSMDDLNAASLDDVHSWFKEYYGTANAVVVLAGDINAADAKPLMEKYFGDIPSGPPLKRLKEWIPDRVANTKEIMYDRVPQTRIMRVWAVPSRTSEDLLNLDLASDVLGSGKTSRLYKELVYKRQIATSASAYIMPFEIASIFGVSVTLKAGQSEDEVNAVIDDIMAEFLAKGPSKKELEKVKTSTISGIVRGLEQIGGFSGKATALARGELYA